MTPTLEIVLPLCDSDNRMLRTTASLVAQTDRRFEVLIGENVSLAGLNYSEEVVRQLVAAGITVRWLKAPLELKRLELWNWIHSQATADWLKPLCAGDVLRPDYVAQLRKRLEERPGTQFVRCDAEVRTEWGLEILRAPFDGRFIEVAEFLNYFPSRIEWICRAANVAYSRIAWLALGGYCVQLPGFASLNLNVTLALHHGVENIAESLVLVESTDRLPLNEFHDERVRLPAELWLVLRQARNYCIAAKLPWRCQRLWLRTLMAALGHW